MGQITLQKRKRRKITTALPSPEIILEGFQDGENVKFFVKINFDDSGKYLSKDSKIILYPMTKQGVVLLPIYLGTVGEIKIDEKGYFVTDEMMENLYFNLKISTANSNVEGFAYKLRFKKPESGEGEVEDQDGDQQSILPIVEVPNQSIPFKVLMQPVQGEPPTLFVRSGLKNKIKSSAITQYIVTTSAIKTIITNYILDRESDGDIFKEKWEILIKNLINDKKFMFPSREEALDRSGTLNSEIEDIIEDVITQFGRKRKFRGTQYSLSDAFINEVSLPKDEEENENDSM